MTDLVYSFVAPLENVTELIFIIDLILPFFLEYETDDGRIVRRLNKIAERYVKSITFRIDLFAVLLTPLVVILYFMYGGKNSRNPEATRYIQLLLIFKVVRIKRALETFSPIKLRKLVSFYFESKKNKQMKKDEELFI